jgi:probable rRNA maturation factor
MGVVTSRQGATLPLRPVSSLGRAALRAVGRPKAELSIVVCDDAFIRDLNLRWRGKDAATDVLSFPMDAEVLGDIVISVQTAERQAEAVGHPLQSELAVLLVHGLLHLLGHDHETPAEDRAMAEEERRVLAILGVGGQGLVGRAGG